MCPDTIYEPSVSVIVPVLNAEATIGDLLDSLGEIDYDRRKLEVILVDGDSTDRTREIIQRYPVKLIIEKRRGLNVARNTGVENSNGEIILFTDADCVAPRDWVKKTVKNFEDPQVGCVGGTVSRYGDDFLSKYADESLMPVLRRFKKREELADVKPVSRYPAGCNMAFRRGAVEEAKGFDEEIKYGFDEDELVERVCKSGHKMVLDHEVIIRHQHRATLKSLLKQTFNYGRGGALLLKKRRAKDQFSRWLLTSILLFAGWLILSASFAILAVIASPLFLFLFLFFTVVPFFLLVLFYAHKAPRGGGLVIVVTYPFIDLFRLFAFCIGETYELAK
jgi:cellulose synthase/poly-beta-1,6-N-acetylglucosamine synthase-like glycosyltransferase